MNLTRLTYNGRKTYREKLTGTTWNPGESHLVPEKAATKLLRFAEFALSEKKAGKVKEADEEVLKAELIHAQKQREEDREDQQLESMLLTVESMDKAALEQYARKYEVELDKRRSLDTLRAEVSTLIEQFGAR